MFVNKVKISSFFLISLFFPYIKPGFSLRIDHLFILFPFVLIITSYKHSLNKILFLKFCLASIYFSYLVFLLYFNELTINRTFFQLVIQYSYYISTIAFLLVFYKELTSHSLKYINIAIILITFSIIYSFIQFFFPNSSFVSFITLYYSGTIGGGMSKVYEALTQLRASSFFVQPSSFGMFCLISYCYVSLYNKSKELVLFRILLACIIVAGIFSATKVFIFGFFIFYLLTKFFSSPSRFFLKVPIYLIFISTFIALAYYINPFVRKIVNWFLDYGIIYFFESRFSTDSGYLSENYSVILQNIYFCVGINVFSYKYADSMPIMLLLLGGLPLLFFYLQYIFTISYSRIFIIERLSLLATLILVSSSFPVFIQSRIIPFYIILDFIIVSHYAQIPKLPRSYKS